MKRALATMAILALLVSNGMAQESPGPECNHHDRAQGKPGKHRDMMADIPDLTAEQEELLKRLKEDGFKSTEHQREAMHELRKKLHTLKTAEEPDTKAIYQLIDEVHLLKAEMEKSRTAYELKMRGVLTPEQLTAFDAKRKERRDKHGKMRQERKTR